MKDILKFLESTFREGYSNSVYLQINIASLPDVTSIGQDRSSISQNILNLILLNIGSGKFCMPSFTFSWGENKKLVFDKQKSMTHIGMLPNFMIESDNFFRTLDPMYSVISNDNKYHNYDNLNKIVFGEHSYWNHMYENDYDLVCIGTPYLDPTFLHYCEYIYNREYLDLNYRSEKVFEGKYIYNGNLIHDSVRCLSRVANYRYNYDLIKDNLIKSNNIISKNYRNCTSYRVSSKKYFNEVISILKSEFRKDFVLF